MNVLIVGSGAREHAIVDAVLRSESKPKIYAVVEHQNPGIINKAEDYLLGSITNTQKIVEYACSKNINLTVVGPEAPLAVGLVNELEAKGIPTVGPSSQSAKIETSKSYMRNLMKKYRIPGLIRYGVFKEVRTAKAFIDELDGNVAVKPVGLTGGKGVKVIGDHLRDSDEAVGYVREILDKRIGGKSKVLIEERVEGEEYTLQAFCDGNVALPMPTVQDHKRAFEGDLGPNTGGMGSYSSSDGILPFLTRDIYEDSILILQRFIDALKAEGHPYKGILYGQFMLTAQGPVIIECNARFGDPEALNVLPLLKTDFLELCNAIVEGNISQKHVVFMNKSTVCKYVVPKGYGTPNVVKTTIEVNDKAIRRSSGVRLFYAAVNLKDGKLHTTTSRALALLGIANKIYEAERKVERALTYIRGENLYIRHDIGKKQLIRAKVKRMEQLLKQS